jgi:glycosyltransferase involved in cell wall biosynthesis
VHIVTHKPAVIPGVSVERFRIPGPTLANPRRWHRRWEQYLRGFLRGFDIVNVHFLCDWGFTPEIMNDGCLIASAWGSDIVPPPGEEPPSPDLTASRVMLLRNADTVTTCGPTFAAAVAKFAQIDVGCIDVVPFGVDLQLFTPGEATARQCPDPYRVGFFKGFRQVYGPTVLVRAIPLVLNELPDPRFDLVGDGPQLSECQTLAETLGVDSSVQWIPRQPHNDIPRLLTRWDLTVIASVYEAFGVAALESSAMGVPVVATDVGGLRDTVRHGETGLLIPAKSVEVLADAMVTLLRDGRRRLQMGQAGREWVRKHFDRRLVLDQWVHTYHRALDRASAMV